MHRGHQALGNAKVVVHHLGQRGQAVGGARRVGDDGLARVLVLVHAHDKHGRVGGGRRNDDGLGAALEVGGRRLGLGEDARRFDDKVGAGRGPRDGGRVALGEHGDVLAAHGQAAGAALSGLGQDAVHGVVLQHVRGVVALDERVVDGHDFHVVALQADAQDEAADAAEACKGARPTRANPPTRRAAPLTNQPPPSPPQNEGNSPLIPILIFWPSGPVLTGTTAATTVDGVGAAERRADGLHARPGRRTGAMAHAARA